MERCAPFKTLAAVVGLLALGSAALTQCPPPPTTVASDHVTLTATGGGLGPWHSTTCPLVSDGETEPVSCNVSFHINTSGFTFCAVNGSLSSPDGTTTFAGRPCGASCRLGRLQTSVGGTEADAPENGKPSNSYPATVNLTMTRVSGQRLNTVSGTIDVSESSTSP
jgi:hypothetical protein